MSVTTIPAATLDVPPPVTALRPTSIKSLAIRGSAWTIGGYGSSQALRLGSHLVLAWLLAPEIFGLMALVKVVQQGLEMFSDIGIQPSIIQNPRGTEPIFLNTAWTMQVVRGFVLWAGACVLAWPFAAVFARNDPGAWQLLYLLPVVGIGAVISGFNSTALATLNKELRLGRITMLEISSQVVSLTVMLSWALITPTVWAMVAGGLVAGVYKLGASHQLVPGSRVRFAWDRSCAVELTHFGKWVFLSTAFTFLALNLDKLILGNVLTLADLGLYSIAFVFGKVALYVSSQLGGTVLYPVYAKHRGEPARLMSIALRAREVVLWVGVSVSVCLAIGSPLFFETLWDPRYHAAGSIAQWMSLYIWAMIVMLTMDRIPLAMGNSRALFVANVWRTAGIVFAVAGYVAIGLPGFIVGLAVGPVIAHGYMIRHVPTKRRELLMQGVWFTVGGLLYAIPAVLLVNSLRARGGMSLWAFGVGVLGGAPLAVAALIVWKRIWGTKPPTARTSHVAAVEPALTA
jgi:O-antigen/teichoic acid export membrane protein